MSSGEYGSPGMNWNTCRGKDEEIVISSEVSAPAGINSAASQVTFLLPAPIPINATDIILQVVYRGPLGDETDAVVVATKDISEPTYIERYDWRDQYFWHGYYPNIYGTVDKTFEQWCTGGGITYDDCKNKMGRRFMGRFSVTPNYDPANPKYPPEFQFTASDDATFFPVFDMAVPVGSYGRVALLTDPSTMLKVYFRWESLGFSSNLAWWNYGDYPVNFNQVNPVNNTLTPTSTYKPNRGFYSTPVEDQLYKMDNPSVPPLAPVLSTINF
jgi:hypothetical protein